MTFGALCLASIPALYAGFRLQTAGLQTKRETVIRKLLLLMGVCTSMLLALTYLGFAFTSPAGQFEPLITVRWWLALFSLAYLSAFVHVARKAA
jgi:hypothetical protein